MEAHGFTGAVWRKSSRTVSGKCVEVAMTSVTVGVRDSKDREGAVLVFPFGRWADFIGAVRCGGV